MPYVLRAYSDTSLLPVLLVPNLSEGADSVGAFEFTVALRPQKPQGLLGTRSQDGHLDFHTASELWSRA